MISWFLSLDKAAQAAIASGVVSSLVIGIIAGLGFWITFKTSTAANERIVNVTRENNFYEMKFRAEIRIAEMRQAWIEDLRQHLAQFAEEAFKSLIIAQKGGDVFHLRIQYLRSYIRLKINNKEDSHKRLFESIRTIIGLLNAVIDDAESQAANEFRDALSNFEQIADAILKEEWQRVKTEIRAVNEQLKANLTR
jgi:F0F1-type ATP synthase membrane subunit b/b'